MAPSAGQQRPLPARERFRTARRLLVAGLLTGVLALAVLAVVVGPARPNRSTQYISPALLTPCLVGLLVAEVLLASALVAGLVAAVRHRGWARDHELCRRESGVT